MLLGLPAVSSGELHEHLCTTAASSGRTRWYMCVHDCCLQWAHAMVYVQQQGVGSVPAAVGPQMHAPNPHQTPRLLLLLLLLACLGCCDLWCDRVVAVAVEPRAAA